jgi:hypothetical protein
MDTKKVLQMLVKIADSQQKIINKLAQAQALPPDALPTSQISMTEGHGMPPSTPPPPAKLEPTQTKKTPAKALWDALPPPLQGTLAAGPEAHGNDMKIRFKPGQATQANYDAVMKHLKDLTNKNVIQQPYQLKVS